MVGRTAIPAAVKLSVRQRARFGCVMCGSPIYDYEHIDGYNMTGHDPDAMTLLCPMHHREKTAGRLPTELVRRAASSPYNLSHSVGANHPLFYEPGSMILELGNVHLVRGDDQFTEPFGIEIDGQIVLGGVCADGAIEMSIDLRDANNVVLLRVIRGQLRVSTRALDITFVGQVLTIGSLDQQTYLRIVFAPPRIVVESAFVSSQFVRMLIGDMADGGGITFPDSRNSFTDLTIAGGTILVGDMNQHSMLQVNPRRAYGSLPIASGSSFSKPEATR